MNTELQPIMSVCVKIREQPSLAEPGARAELVTHRLILKSLHWLCLARDNVITCQEISRRSLYQAQRRCLIKE